MSCSMALHFNAVGVFYLGLEEHFFKSKVQLSYVFATINWSDVAKLSHSYSDHRFLTKSTYTLFKAISFIHNLTVQDGLSVRLDEIILPIINQTNRSPPNIDPCQPLNQYPNILNCILKTHLLTGIKYIQDTDVL